MLIRLAAQFAWANFADDWRRSLVRCTGIAFAVLLMFMEIGFRNALFDSNVRIVERKINADIVIRSESRFMLSSRQLMPFNHVIAARSCVGVRTVEPLYFDNTVTEFRSEGHPSRRLRVMAFDPGSDIFANFELAGFADQLNETGTAAADIKSKPLFGFPHSMEQLPTGNKYELAGKSIRLVGLFENGIDFSNDGNLIMTPHNFAFYISQRGGGNPLSMVDYALVRCEPNVDHAEVIARLRTQLGPDVIVETRDSFLNSEREFWSSNTPIGLVFWVGTIIGFIVGMSICYQVLATDIRDHLSEFSTLKAMGYSPGFFAMIVIAQALLLSVISFVPGFIVAILAYQGTNLGTGLFLFLDFQRTSLVLGLTVLMCVFSGIIALRKLLTTDPASLFK